MLNNRWSEDTHNTGVDIEGVIMLTWMSFILKSPVLCWWVHSDPLRWTPHGKEVTECSPVASGSAAGPAASPSGFQTRRSPAGWGCHKLRLWKPPTTETHNMLMNRQRSQPCFYICIRPSRPRKCFECQPCRSYIETIGHRFGNNRKWWKKYSGPSITPLQAHLIHWFYKSSSVYWSQRAGSEFSKVSKAIILTMS